MLSWAYVDEEECGRKERKKDRGKMKMTGRGKGREGRRTVKGTRKTRRTVLGSAERAERSDSEKGWESGEERRASMVGRKMARWHRQREEWRDKAKENPRASLT